MNVVKKVILILVLIVMIWCVKSYITVSTKAKQRKVLNCTREIKEESYIANEKRTFYFHKDYNYLEFYSQNLVINYGTNEIFANEQYQKFKNLCNELKDFAGFSCSIKKDNESTTVIVELDVVVAELEDDSQQYSGDLKGKNISYYSIKNKMESSELALTCEDQ